MLQTFDSSAAGLAADVYAALVTFTAVATSRKRPGYERALENMPQHPGAAEAGAVVLAGAGRRALVRGAPGRLFYNFLSRSFLSRSFLPQRLSAACGMP